ncbi:MAG TPA: formate acetyltransferase, partial [Clostridiales bacterium]|nr:formate acetyltransferase [Clostridiales bacterium]
YYLFTDRNGWPRFSGDRGLLNYMKNKGVTKKHARNRIAVGCNWMALPGLEYPINDCVKINTAKVFEVALNQMRAESEYSTTRLYELFCSHLVKAVDVTAKGINHHLDYQRYVMPELVMNLMMVGTLESGKDISEIALFHTMGVDGVGLGTVADSFAALQQRIEKEKILTWLELFQALDANYENTENERIRLMLKSAEKYCSGNSLGDKWAKCISDRFAQTVHNYPMPEGRELVPGWFSWSSTIAFGKAVGPTPDGRFSQAPITHGANPSPGFRKDGAASAMSTGVAMVQTAYGNTCPLQLEFDPKLSVDEGGLESVEQLLRTHFELGGTLVNINILDRKTIMEAHNNPMSHPALVVRVTGFTAYFVTLSPEFRQLVVDRFVDGF